MSRHLILLLEPYKATRDILSNVLVHDFDLIVPEDATDWESALLMGDAPDVVVIDMALHPHLYADGLRRNEWDGLRVVEAMRYDVRTHGALIIVTSTVPTKAWEELAYLSGADVFFGKPLSPRDLAETIASKLIARAVS